MECNKGLKMEFRVAVKVFFFFLVIFLYGFEYETGIVAAMGSCYVVFLC